MTESHHVLYQRFWQQRVPWVISYFYTIQSKWWQFEDAWEKGYYFYGEIRSESSLHSNDLTWIICLQRISENILLGNPNHQCEVVVEFTDNFRHTRTVPPQSWKHWTAYKMTSSSIFSIHIKITILRFFLLQCKGPVQFPTGEHFIFEYSFRL